MAGVAGRIRAAEAESTEMEMMDTNTKPETNVFSTRPILAENSNMAHFTPQPENVNFSDFHMLHSDAENFAMAHDGVENDVEKFVMTSSVVTENVTMETDIDPFAANIMPLAANMTPFTGNIPVVAVSENDIDMMPLAANMTPYTGDIPVVAIPDNDVPMMPFVADVMPVASCQLPVASCQLPVAENFDTQMTVETFTATNTLVSLNDTDSDVFARLEPEIANALVCDANADPEGIAAKAIDWLYEKSMPDPMISGISQDDISKSLLIDASASENISANSNELFYNAEDGNAGMLDVEYSPQNEQMRYIQDFAAGIPQTLPDDFLLGSLFDSSGEYDTDSEIGNIEPHETPDAALSHDTLLTPGSPPPTPVSGAEYEPPELQMVNMVDLTTQSPMQGTQMFSPPLIDLTNDESRPYNLETPQITQMIKSPIDLTTQATQTTQPTPAIIDLTSQTTQTTQFPHATQTTQTTYDRDYRTLITDYRSPSTDNSWMTYDSEDDSISIFQSPPEGTQLPSPTNSELSEYQKSLNPIVDARSSDDESILTPKFVTDKKFDKKMKKRPNCYRIREFNDVCKSASPELISRQALRPGKPSYSRIDVEQGPAKCESAPGKLNTELEKLAELKKLAGELEIERCRIFGKRPKALENANTQSWRSSMSSDEDEFMDAQTSKQASKDEGWISPEIMQEMEKEWGDVDEKMESKNDDIFEKFEQSQLMSSQEKVTTENRKRRQDLEEERLNFSIKKRSNILWGKTVNTKRPKDDYLLRQQGVDPCTSTPVKRHRQTPSDDFDWESMISDLEMSNVRRRLDF